MLSIYLCVMSLMYVEPTANHQEIWIANTDIRKLDAAIATLPVLRKLGVCVCMCVCVCEGVRGCGRRGGLLCLLYKQLVCFKNNV